MEVVNPPNEALFADWDPEVLRKVQNVLRLLLSQSYVHEDQYEVRKGYLSESDICIPFFGQYGPSNGAKRA